MKGLVRVSSVIFRGGVFFLVIYYFVEIQGINIKFLRLILFLLIETKGDCFT